MGRARAEAKTRRDNDRNGESPTIAQTFATPADALPAAPLLHVVLHQPEIPQNTGNVGRTCLAAGARLWLVRPLGFQLDAKHLRRAGLDYWQHLDWEAVDDWQSLAVRFDPQRVWMFSKAAKRLYTDVAFQPGDAMVFGSETTGLPRSMVASAGEQALRMPVRPPVRSLNLSSCVAVAVYEAIRQFRQSGLD